MTANPEETKSTKKELTYRITKKLNKLLSDEEIVKRMRDYYFEPVRDEDGEDPIFQFTNPFNGKSFQFRWDSVKSKPILLDEEHDEDTLNEFHNALAHFVSKQKEIKRRQIKQFLDFYEDELHLKVILEIPEQESGEEIQLKASPYILEVTSGDYYRKIKLNTTISPKSGRAQFHAEDNILEITFKKSLRLQRKRRIRIRKL
ncbi:MAG: hypothetical protein DRO88_08070 [Promethearchaeia archaeon]|nr:MAG: hypothetical protein DRO88_08070 [Candidatus Lokiarchaeia archaeon]